MAETKCPKCGSVAECFCIAGGKNGDFDRFVLRCNSCGHSSRIRKYIGKPEKPFAGSLAEAYPLCQFCGQNYTKHKTPPKEEKLAKNEIDFKRIREFESLGECAKSPTGNHRLKMVGYPNPKICGARIAESFYDFLCYDCQKEFHIPNVEIQKEVEV